MLTWSNRLHAAVSKTYLLVSHNDLSGCSPFIAIAISRNSIDLKAETVDQMIALKAVISQ